MRTFEAVYSKDGTVTDTYTVSNEDMIKSMYGSVAQFMTEGDTLVYTTGHEKVTITAHVNSNVSV